MARLCRKGDEGTVRSILIALATTLWLAACDGGGTDAAPGNGAPDSGSGPESPTDCDTGAIEGGGKQKMSGIVAAIHTGGHLVVGRTDFATNGASITVDGQPASISDLHEGDVVIVTGTIDTAQETGCAKAVYADASIVGPVRTINTAARSFQLLSLTVQLRDDTVLTDFDGTRFTLSDLRRGDTVRVSGLPSGGVIVATRVQRVPYAESYFVSGPVTALDQVTQRFWINGIGVQYDRAVLSGFPDGQPHEGDPVRLSGTDLTANVLWPDAIQYIDYDTPVSVFPGIAALQITESIQFRAFVDSGDPVVSWSVLDADGEPCGATECGSIDATGLYTAPWVAHVQGVLVRATSVADPDSSDTVSIFIYPPIGGLAVVPASATLAAGSSQSFSAYTAAGSPPGGVMEVTWSLAGKGCVGDACGTIDADGNYRAPDTLPDPAVVTVTARGALMPGIYGSGTINLGANPNLTHLKGRYAFILSGVEPDATTEPSERIHIMAIGSIVADGAGRVTSGVEYVNRKTTVSRHAPVTGSYSINDDGRGYVQFHIPDDGVRKFSIALAEVVDGVARTVRVTSHFADRKFTGTMRRQNEADFRAASLAGDYAFSLDGQGDSVFRHMVAAGRFTLVAGQLKDGQVSDHPAAVKTISGEFAPNVDANGEVRLQVSIESLPEITQFAGFVVSAGEVLLMQADPRSTGLSGTMLRQQGGPFDEHAFSGESIVCFSWTGYPALTRYQSAGDGRLTSEALYYDDYTEWTETSRSGSYDVAANGRAALSFGSSLVEQRFYFIEPGKAFAISKHNATGMLYSKVSAATSLNGRYVLSSQPNAMHWTMSASSAVLMAYPSGSIAGTFDGEASGRAFAGPYEFDSGSMRIMLTRENETPEENRFWMVSDSLGIGISMGSSYVPDGCRMVER